QGRRPGGMENAAASFRRNHSRFSRSVSLFLCRTRWPGLSPGPARRRPLTAPPRRSATRSRGAPRINEVVEERKTYSSFKPLKGFKLLTVNRLSREIEYVAKRGGDTRHRAIA